MSSQLLIFPFVALAQGDRSTKLADTDVKEFTTFVFPIYESVSGFCVYFFQIPHISKMIQLLVFDLFHIA